MSTNGDREPAVSEAHLDEVPVELTFGLGSASASLGDIRALGEGHVFRLARPLQDAVDIRLSGELIGRGELVLVDGTLAVRVTRVKLA